jgi:hypothetical protein
MIVCDFELTVNTIVYYMYDNAIYKSFISDKIVHYKNEKGKFKKSVEYWVNCNDFPNYDLKIYLSVKDLCEDLERNLVDETKEMASCG